MFVKEFRINMIAIIFIFLNSINLKSALSLSYVIDFLDNSTCVQNLLCHETKMQDVSVSKPSKSLRVMPVKKPVSETAHSLLKQQCQRLSDQIECYKATWMRKLI